MENKDNGGGGFLFGLIVGGAVVFLLGTDKGRKILKAVTEEGFEGLSDIIEKAEEYSPAGVGEEPTVRVRKEKVVPGETSESQTNGIKSNGHTSPSSPKRRFFRRSKS